MEDGARSGQSPATLRPAATIVLARDSAPAPGVEVLVLRRSTVSRFAPGFVVFPGGSVSTEDADLAVRWFGDASQSPRACALRELAEEAGLVLTADGVREARGRLGGGPDLPPPSPSQVAELARWIAPEFLPVRFDARFFGAVAAPGLHPEPDGVEIDHAWWARPREVLEAADRGEAPLMWPTLTFLRALAGCRSAADALMLRVPQVEPGPEARFPAVEAGRP
jgi:8-oxo-dGTP pyrophosphatase MutT (NUDIX family)